MSDMDWSSVFERTYAEAGAHESEIRSMLETALAPLTLEEINQINAADTKPWIDPRKWVIPNRPFPESYLSFLRWSNGGSFFNGERKFDGFFPTDKIREYLLCYWIPMKMPGTVPFSFDGGGNFYLFDMRSEPSDGEFPIVFAPSTGMGWGAGHHHVVVARSFLEACQGTTDPEVELWG